MRKFLLLSVGLLIASLSPAYSELDELAAVKAYEEIQEANMPDAGEKVANDLLRDRVLDKKNRVIGEVNDVILDKNGAIVMLDVDFNRLHNQTNSVLIDYNDMGVVPSTNGYKLNYSDGEIERLMPSMLDNLDTAGGKYYNSNKLSISRLKGQKIYNSQGDIIGEVTDVVFDTLGSYAKKLYIALSDKTVSGKKVAVPFRSINSDVQKLMVSDGAAQAMLKYAQTGK